MKLLLLGRKSASKVRDVIASKFDDIDITLSESIASISGDLSLRPVVFDRIILFQDAITLDPKGTHIDALVSFDRLVYSIMPAVRIVSLSKDRTIADAFAGVFNSPLMTNLCINDLKPSMLVDIVLQPVDAIKSKYTSTVVDEKYNIIQEVIEPKAPTVSKEALKTPDKPKNLLGGIFSKGKAKVKIPSGIKNLVIPKPEVEEAVEPEDLYLKPVLDTTPDVDNVIIEGNGEAPVALNQNVYDKAYARVHGADDEDAGKFILGNESETSVIKAKGGTSYDSNVSTKDAPEDGGLYGGRAGVVRGDSAPFVEEDEIDGGDYGSNTYRNLGGLDTVEGKNNEFEDTEGVDVFSRTGLHPVSLDTNLISANLSSRGEQDTPDYADTLDLDGLDLEQLDRDASEERLSGVGAIKVVEKVRIEKQIQERIVEVPVAGKSLSGLYAILKGTKKVTIVVTGERRSGVTCTAMEVARFFKKKGVNTLFVDLDIKRRSSLLYIGIEEIVRLSDYHQKGISLATNLKTLKNISFPHFEDGYDCLVQMYNNAISEESVRNLQALLSVQSDYGVVVVDCPFENLSLIPSLLQVSEILMCFEATKTGIFNTMLELDSLSMMSPESASLAKRGQYVINKCESLKDFIPLMEFVRSLLDRDDGKPDWTGIRCVGTGGDIGNLLERLYT